MVWAFSPAVHGPSHEPQHGLSPLSHMWKGTEQKMTSNQDVCASSRLSVRRHSAWRHFLPIQNSGTESWPSLQDKRGVLLLDTEVRLERNGRVWAKMVVSCSWPTGGSDLLSELGRPQKMCVLRLPNSEQNEHEGHQAQHRDCNTEPSALNRQ